MVELKPVTTEELEEIKKHPGRMSKGRISYPILKMFIESKAEASVIEDIGDKEPANLAMLLRGYAKRHKLPVQIMTRNKQVILVRIDDPKDEKAQDAIKDLTVED